MKFKRLVFSTAFLYSLLIFLLVLSSTFCVIQFVLDRPYMDEPFHYGQTVSYCIGNYYEYDGKITTPPGLYVIFVAFYKLNIFNCNVSSMRLLCFLFSIAQFICTSYLLCLLDDHNGNETNERKRCQEIGFNSIVINTFPISLFYSVFYYTDIVALFFITCCYILNLKKKYLLSSMILLIATTIRQNNVIFNMFLIGVSIINEYKESGRKEIKNKYKSPKNPSSESFLNIFMDVLKFFFNNWMFLLKSCSFYILNIILFVVFVVINKGVVLGDRENHKSTLHIMQFMYFNVFISILMFPHVITILKTEVSKMKTSSFKFGSITAISIAMMGIIIKRCTVVHPFLLADNRHITFYIWRYFFMKNKALRFCYSPVYIFSIYSNIKIVYNSFENKKNHVYYQTWWIGYFISIFSLLVPSPLLELRYFIVPYFLYRTHVDTKKIYGSLKKQKVAIFTEMIFHLILHISLIFLFIARPFKWENSDEWQRFVW